MALKRVYCAQLAKLLFNLSIINLSNLLLMFDILLVFDMHMIVTLIKADIVTIITDRMIVCLL